MSDEISHAEASTYVPSSEPGPSFEHDHAAPVTAVASVGCMEPEGVRRSVSRMGIIGTGRAQKRAIQAVRYVNLLSRLARDS